MSRHGVIPAALVIVLSGTVGADVIEQSDHGFIVRSEVVVSAPARAVYRALTSEVGAWWNPAHPSSATVDGVLAGQLQRLEAHVER